MKKKKKNTREKSFCSLTLFLANSCHSQYYRRFSLFPSPNPHPIYPQPYAFTLAEPQVRILRYGLDKKVDESFCSLLLVWQLLCSPSKVGLAFDSSLTLVLPVVEGSALDRDKINIILFENFPVKLIIALRHSLFYTHS